MPKSVFPAELTQLDKVIAFAFSALDLVSCPTKVKSQIAVSLEEIFVNVAHYAYPEGTKGCVWLSAEVSPESATFIVMDEGLAFNPLEKKDPDITLPPEERPIGGLGIFLVKKLMDEVSYSRRDGKNTLTMVKRWEKS